FHLYSSPSPPPPPAYHPPLHSALPIYGLPARREGLEHLLAILQHHDSPHHILELTHIAAPGILQESGGRLRRELLPSAVLLVELREESGGQAEDLLFAFSQRRDANLHHVETVVEIFPEVTAGERVLE